jgi:hypothetical protein
LTLARAVLHGDRGTLANQLDRPMRVAMANAVASFYSPRAPAAIEPATEQSDRPP